MQPAVVARPRRASPPWIPTVVVAGTLSVILFGGYVLSGQGAAGEPGQPIEVLQGVTIIPSAGWGFRGYTQTPPGTFLQGNGGLMFVTAGTGTTASPEALVDSYLASLETTAEPVTYSRGPTELITIPAGPGAQAAYAGVFDGNPLEGAVYGIVTPSGLGITLDGYATAGQYYPILADQVGAMVGSMRAA